MILFVGAENMFNLVRHSANRFDSMLTDLRLGGCGGENSRHLTSEAAYS